MDLLHQCKLRIPKMIFVTLLIGLKLAQWMRQVVEALMVKALMVKAMVIVVPTEGAVIVVLTAGAVIVKMVAMAMVLCCM